MHPKDLTSNLSKADPKTFGMLFSEYYGPLCLYAMRFTRDKASAEEIVHETFVKLWEYWENLEVTETVTGYLYKSVQNNSLNYLKKEQIKNKYSEAYAQKLKNAEEYFTVTQESGLSVVLAKELESRILEAIDLLPEQCRDIFKLSRFAGLKNQEIAQKKKVTLNTVQKQISIALEKLRKSLDSYLPLIIHLLVLTTILN